MAIDNQLVIGTVIFAGLAYFVFAQKDEDPVSDRRHEKNKEKKEIWGEYEELVNRLREFKTNDSKKGRFKQIAPLSESDRAGLIEVITRANQLDKRQSKEQALPRDEARRLHSGIGDIATEAQKFLDRYKLSCESGEKDIRTVSRGIARRESAITRGRISHSRMDEDVDFVTDRSRSGSKKRKIDFVSNQKPNDVFSAERASDNTLSRDRTRSAFETSEPRDDTHDHARQDAEMEERSASGAHGKDGSHIRPVDRPKSSRSKSGDVRFDQANGPEDDNLDRVERTVSTEESQEDTEIVDLTGNISQEAEERMEQDLVDKMEQLASGALKLTESLNKQLRTAVSVLYQDDPEEGDRNIQLLRKYEARDMRVIGIIQSIPEQQSGKKRTMSEALIPRGTEKLTITQEQSGERRKISRGPGQLGQRDPVPAPVKYPKRHGHYSVSQEEAYEKHDMQLRQSMGLELTERQKQMLKNVKGGDI